MARGHSRDLCGADDNAHRRRGPLRGTPARGPATDGHHEGGRPNLAHAWRRATGGGTAISRRRRRLFSAVARHEIAAPGARRRVRGPRWVEDDDACARRPCTRSGSAAGPGRPLFAARPAAPWGTPARSRARMAAMGRVRRPRARHWATGTTYAACARAASAEGVRASVLPRDGRAVWPPRRVGCTTSCYWYSYGCWLLGQQQARAAHVGVRHARRGAVHGRHY